MLSTHITIGRKKIQRSEERDVAVLAAAQDILMERLRRPGTVISEPHMAAAYFKHRLAEQTREVFAVLLLDNAHRVIAYEEVFHGTYDRSEVHPREVVLLALKHHAVAILAAHNHPSQRDAFSSADRAMTARLKEALALVDMRLLDHVLIAGNTTVSMAAQGLL